MLSNNTNQEGFTVFIYCKPLYLLVRQAGFEPAAYGFVVRRSIRAELLAHANRFKFMWYIS